MKCSYCKKKIYWWQRKLVFIAIAFHRKCHNRWINFYPDMDETAIVDTPSQDEYSVPFVHVLEGGGSITPTFFVMSCHSVEEARKLLNVDRPELIAVLNTHTGKFKYCSNMVDTEEFLSRRDR